MAKILISEYRQLIEQLEIAFYTQEKLYRILLEEKEAQDETISVLAESHRALEESHRSLLEEKEAQDETISVLAESHRALEESHRSLLEENEAKDETIKDQQQVIDDLKRKLDCQPNYCENDGSSNCIMSRSRICSR
jgi:chromosome segregation ATPase